MIHLHSSKEDAGKRLDQFLREKLPQYSRSRLAEWIDARRVQVNGVAGKRSYLLKGSEQIQVEPASLPPLRAVAEDLPLEILYEDADVIAINKPAGMVVHAGAGRHSGTLTNALVHRFGKLSEVAGDLRPGIVHRLDRFTSGVILVARTDAAHRHLAAQFAGREVEKIYLALVHGRMKTEQGRITTPIARDPVRRTRMTTKLTRGRSAITEYKVLQRFEGFSYLEVKIGTGRTHQIRVHLASIGHPVAGDKLYGAPAAELPRFFLHAHQITFTSPASAKRITCTAPLAPELQQFLDRLATG
ncbi:MAG TPA: RluA family pseudouridine synthase [Bryobacteraceae bacterium]|nr:RluA family pseudouridine synthase [Bryobacteraceae bacterium]